MSFGQSANVFSAANEINVTNTAQLYTDSLTNLKPDIFYRINLTSSSNINFNLDGLTNDVNLELFNNKGEVISRSARKGNLADFISRVVDAGTYFIRVFSPDIDSSKDFLDKRQLGKTQFSFIGSTDSFPEIDNLTSS
ncbi:MAG: hypothetical protein HC908_02535 [Calothrix sp. SM1_7_51]|nr:hypothetical protein [Calothrix sp. SM1_7_51]